MGGMWGGGGSCCYKGAQGTVTLKGDKENPSALGMALRGRKEETVAVAGEEEEEKEGTFHTAALSSRN